MKYLTYTIHSQRELNDLEFDGMGSEDEYGQMTVKNQNIQSKVSRGVVDILLARMNYEYVYMSEAIDESLFSIRGMKNYIIFSTFPPA